MVDFFGTILNFLVDVYNSLYLIVDGFFAFLDFEITASVLSSITNALGSLFPGWEDVVISFTVGEALYGAGLTTVLTIIIFKWVIPFW